MTAVGKLNPNSTIKEYMQGLKEQPRESDIVCQQIADILGDGYQAWWEKTPEQNAEFLQFAKDTLSTLIMCGGLTAAIEIAYSNSITMTSARYNMEMAITLKEQGAKWDNYEWAKNRLFDAVTFEPLI